MGPWRAPERGRAGQPGVLKMSILVRQWLSLQTRFRDAGLWELLPGQLWGAGRGGGAHRIRLCTVSVSSNPHSVFDSPGSNFQRSEGLPSPIPPYQKGHDLSKYPRPALCRASPDTCKLCSESSLHTSRELSERIRAGQSGEEPTPAPDLLPSFASPGAQRPGICSSPCCAAFSSLGLEAFCLAACQRE